MRGRRQRTNRKSPLWELSAHTGGAARNRTGKHTSKVNVLVIRSYVTVLCDTLTRTELFCVYELIPLMPRTILWEGAHPHLAGNVFRGAGVDGDELAPPGGSCPS